MKRIVIAACAAAVLMVSGLLPFRRTDVAELIPVQTLTVGWEENRLVLNGEDCLGYGPDWESALADLEAGAEGTVFLGTVEQILLSERALEFLPEVIRCQRLRPAAAVCVCRGTLPEPEEATAYLSVHDAGMTIRKIQSAVVQSGSVRLPLLENTEGGLRLRGT